MQLRTSSTGSLTNALSQHFRGNYRPSTTTITSLHRSWPWIKIGTWNVRGANVQEKRDVIDRHLTCENLGIVALQETKLTSRTCDTHHYKWTLGKGIDSARNARRLAFLVHVSLVVSCRNPVANMQGLN